MLSTPAIINYFELLFFFCLCLLWFKSEILPIGSCFEHLFPIWRHYWGWCSACRGRCWDRPLKATNFVLPGLLLGYTQIHLTLTTTDKAVHHPHNELKTLSRGNLTHFTCFGQLFFTGVTVTLTMPCLAHMAIFYFCCFSSLSYCVAGCFLLSALFILLSFSLREWVDSLSFLSSPLPWANG